MASLGEGGGEPVIVAEQGWQARAERDTGCTRQGGEIEYNGRLLRRGQGQRVRHHDTAFRIGVTDLDRDTLARGNHVHRPVGVTGH